MTGLNPDLAVLLLPVRLLAMDVDGVLTDGGIVWSVDAAGSLIESKTFDVADGLGLSLARAAGLKIAWITGRRSVVVEKRAEELGIREVLQGSRDKRAVLTALTARLGLTPDQVLYIGDDLNDLPAFDAAGVRVTVSSAGEETRSRAHWITSAPGGRGAVREVIEGVLKTQGRWQIAVDAFLNLLREEQARPLQ